MKVGDTVSRWPIDDSVYHWYDCGMKSRIRDIMWLWYLIASGNNRDYKEVSYFQCFSKGAKGKGTLQ